MPVSAVRTAPACNRLEHIRYLLGRIAGLGFAPAEILDGAGVDIGYEAIVGGELTALSRPQFIALRRHLLRLLYPFPTVADHRPICEDDLHLLCLSLVTSATLGEAIERFARLMVLTDFRAGRLELQVSGGVAYLHLEKQHVQPEWQLFSIVDMLSVLRRLFSWMIDAEIVAVYWSEHAADADGRAVAAIFSQLIRFGAERNALVFDAEYLQRPVLRRREEWQAFLVDLPFDAVDADPCGSGLAPPIRAAYRAALLAGGAPAAPAALARQFCLSEATLRRRLRDEGTSIRRIRDEVRRDLACAYLHAGTGAARVAQQLGFSCSKAFARAFAVWTGQSPAAYQRGARAAVPVPGVCA